MARTWKGTKGCKGLTVGEMLEAAAGALGGLAYYFDRGDDVAWELVEGEEGVDAEFIGAAEEDPERREFGPGVGSEGLC